MALETAMTLDRGLEYQQAYERLERLVHNIGPCPQCGKDHAASIRMQHAVFGLVFMCPDCEYTMGKEAWPPHPRYAELSKLGNKL